MTLKKFLFFAPLANAAGHFEEIDLGPGLTAEKWPAGRIRKLAMAIEGLPTWEVAFRLDDAHCVRERKRYGFVALAEKRIEVATVWSVDGIIAIHRELDAVGEQLDARLRLLRLAKDGNVRAPIKFWYTMDKWRVEMESAAGWEKVASDNIFFVRRGEGRSLNSFVSETAFPLRHKFLQLAFDHLEVAYATEEPHVQFLSLMIALEALFNVGPQDLRYRISRSAAALLGTNIEECQDIMKTLRRYYDKRSALVHTGAIDGITSLEILFLRHYVRAAMHSIMKLGVDKETLARRLDATGFGDGVA